MQDQGKNLPGDISKIYRTYGPLVYRICWKYVRNGQTALDLRQDIFIKVMKGLNHYRGDCQLGSWIRKIAENHCLDHLRNRRRGACIVSESKLDYECDIEGPGHGEEILLRNDLAPLLDPCSAETRLILQLHYWEGYSQDEVAEVLGCSRGKIGRRLRNFSRKVCRDSPSLFESIS